MCVCVHVYAHVCVCVYVCGMWVWLCVWVFLCLFFQLHICVCVSAGVFLTRARGRAPGGSWRLSFSHPVGTGQVRNVPSLHGTLTVGPGGEPGQGSAPTLRLSPNLSHSVAAHTHTARKHGKEAVPRGQSSGCMGAQWAEVGQELSRRKGPVSGGQGSWRGRGTLEAASGGPGALVSRRVRFAQYLPS